MKDLAILTETRRMGRCRSCGAPIEWATILGSEKAMPFNPPIVVYPALAWDDVEPSVQRVDMSQTTSHFANCPQAKEWRKK